MQIKEKHSASFKIHIICCRTKNQATETTPPGKKN